MTGKLALEAAQLMDRLERLARSGAAEHSLNPAQWGALRYLAHANRFSRTPAALADYLASTRGTVSQTLIALESKGYVSRAASDRDKRSVELDLTDKGSRAIAEDPLLEIARDIAANGANDVKRLVETLRMTLRHAIDRNQGRVFGVCRTCRYFAARSSAPRLHPYHCTLLDVPLSKEDSGKICVEQEPADTGKGNFAGRRLARRTAG